MGIDSDLIRGHVDTIILKTLTDGDKYGYEIIKEITEKSNGSYELKQPTLYSCLKRLENQGLISAYWKNSDIGGKRHYYKLTKKGRNYYETNMNEWFASRNIIDNLMGSKSVTVEDSTPLLSQEPTAQPLKESEPENVVGEPELELDETMETPEQSAQLMFEDESCIIPSDTDSTGVDPDDIIDYEIEDLSEADSELLKGYYKTDDDQINFFASNTFEDENKDYLSEIISHQQTQEEQASPPLASETSPNPFWCGTPIMEANYENFNNGEQDSPLSEEDTSSHYELFSGADLSLYRQNTGSNYFDSISEEQEDKIFEQEIIDVQSNANSNELSNDQLNEDEKFIKLFGEAENLTSLKSSLWEEDSKSFIKDELDNEMQSKNDEGEQSLLQEYTSTKLNFGYSSDEDGEDDELYMPHSFNDNFSSNIEVESDYEDKISSYTATYGTENEEYTELQPAFEESNNAYNLDVLDESDYTAQSDDLTTGISQRESVKLSYTPKFTEINDKEKLNHLSSYAMAPTYELKTTAELQTENTIDYAELTEEFSEVGLKVKPYIKREKEPSANKKYLLVNKIKFVTSWITYASILVLLFTSYFIAKSVGYLDLSLTTSTMSGTMHFIIAGLIMLIFPAVYTGLYLFNKTKKVKPNYSAFISFIFALLFFVVCLNIIYTINILLGFAKFNQTDYNHLLWLLPSICSLFLIIQSVIYSLLFKSKKFNAS